MIIDTRNVGTLDDSSRHEHGLWFYAHHVNHPRDETNTLVFVSQEPPYRRRKIIEPILQSYLLSALQDVPIIACDHYKHFPLLRASIDTFINRTTVSHFAHGIKTAFSDADSTVRIANREAAALFSKQQFKPGWHAHDDLLIHVDDDAGTPRGIVRMSKEEVACALRDLSRNYTAGYR